MASFKVEDGAPPLILCRHGIAAVLALSRTGLNSPHPRDCLVMVGWVVRA